MIDCRNCKYCPSNYYKGPFIGLVNICYCGKEDSTWGENVCGISNKNGNCPYYKRKWWKFWIK